jgi:hypothetical protein
MLKALRHWYPRHPARRCCLLREPAAPGPSSPSYPSGPHDSAAAYTWHSPSYWYPSSAFAQLHAPGIAAPRSPDHTLSPHRDTLGTQLGSVKGYEVPRCGKCFGSR